MKVLLSIQYDGKNYHGWQEQKTPDTVQGKLQKAIYDFSREKVKLYVAGRTDSGVHALSQYAHFETNTKRDARRTDHQKHTSASKVPRACKRQKVKRKSRVRVNGC